MPRKQGGLKHKLIIRVWGHSHDVMHSHGYLVDDVPIGLSGTIAELEINAQEMTFRQLRPMIEFAQDCGHMKKRGMIFQEALFIMGRMPNIYGRPSSDLQKYRLGFVKKNGNDVKMYNRDQDDTPLVELVGITEFFGHDLVIIPFSQIPPEMDEVDDDNTITDNKFTTPTSSTLTTTTAT